MSCRPPGTGWLTEKIGGWYIYDGTTHLISTVPGVVILIRTADGKYAKMMILSYYKGNPANIDPNKDLSRYYTFKFAYQPDGSRNF